MKKQRYDLEERLLEYSVKQNHHSLFESQTFSVSKTSKIVIPGSTRNPSKFLSFHHINLIPAWLEILSIFKHENTAWKVRK